ASGDRLAFKTLYDRHWDNLYAVALGFLKSPEWSLDILQDVFFKVWVKKEQLSEIDDFGSYLFIMVRNELVTALKSRARMLERNKKYIASLPIGYLTLPDTKITLKE